MLANIKTWLISFHLLIFCVLGLDVMEWLRIDDPVGCFPVHGLAGVWSLISVGLFSEAVPDGTTSNSSKSIGLFKGGEASFFGAQVLACVCFVVWSLIINLLEVNICTQHAINWELEILCTHMII